MRDSVPRRGGLCQKGGTSPSPLASSERASALRRGRRRLPQVLLRPALCKPALVGGQAGAGTTTKSKEMIAVITATRQALAASGAEIKASLVKFPPVAPQRA